MCDRKDCGDPNNKKPWCDMCRGHTQENSHQLHMDREHPKTTPPAPLR